MNLENGGFLPSWIQILLLTFLNILKVSKLFRKTLILSIESGSMCKHQGSLEQSGFYTTLFSFLRLNRTLCGIKHGSTPYLEKKKKIVQRRRGFSMLLFPLPLARSKENGNIEFRILIGCVPYTMKPVYTLPAARKRLLQTRLYSEALSVMNLTYQESRILLSIISTPSLTFLIPFVIINAEF